MRTFEHAAASVERGSLLPNARAARSLTQASWNPPFIDRAKPWILLRLIHIAVVDKSGVEVRATGGEGA